MGAPEQVTDRILLVGEANPYGGDPDMALYPLPARASGGRLASILGLSTTQYLRQFRRANLCAQKWDLREARARAEVLKEQGPLVLCGAKVCKAFGFRFAPFTVDRVLFPGRPATLTYGVLPHPSGLSRAWNDPRSTGLARQTVWRVSESAAESWSR